MRMIIRITFIALILTCSSRSEEGDSVEKEKKNSPTISISGNNDVNLTDFDGGKKITLRLLKNVRNAGMLNAKIIDHIKNENASYIVYKVGRFILFDAFSDASPAWKMPLVVTSSADSISKTELLNENGVIYILLFKGEQVLAKIRSDKADLILNEYINSRLIQSLDKPLIEIDPAKLSPK